MKQLAKIIKGRGSKKRNDTKAETVFSVDITDIIEAPNEQ